MPRVRIVQILILLLKYSNSNAWGQRFLAQWMTLSGKVFSGAWIPVPFTREPHSHIEVLGDCNCLYFALTMTDTSSSIYCFHFYYCCCVYLWLVGAFYTGKCSSVSINGCFFIKKISSWKQSSSDECLSGSLRSHISTCWLEIHYTLWFTVLSNSISINMYLKTS